MIQPATASRLTVQPAADLPLPVVFPAPMGTITFKITKSLLLIYVEPLCHPLDWDVAKGLMLVIAARSRRVPSMLAHLREFAVELVDCARALLTLRP